MGRNSTWDDIIEVYADRNDAEYYVKPFTDQLVNPGDGTFSALDRSEMVHYYKINRSFAIDFDGFKPKPRRILREYKTKQEATVDLNQFKATEKFYEEHKGKINLVSHLRIWFNDFVKKASLDGIEIFKIFPIDLYERCITILETIYGTDANIYEAAVSFGNSFARILRTFERKSVEIGKPKKIDPKDCTSKKPKEKQIRLLIRCLIQLFSFAEQDNVLVQKITITYRPDPLKKKGPRPKPVFTESEKDSLILQLVRNNEFYRGKPVTCENYWERVFNLVTFLLITFGQRFPFYKLSKINKAFYKKEILFFQHASQHSDLAERTEISFILSHLKRNGEKGYETVIIAPSLEDEYWALLGPKIEFWKKNNNLPPPNPFGQFMDFTTIPKEIFENGKYQPFPIEVYRSWFRHLLEYSKITNKITPYFLKKLFLSCSCGSGEANTLLQHRMNTIGNKLRTVVDKHYIVSPEFQDQLNPIRLFDAWKDILKFEEQYRYYVKKIREETPSFNKNGENHVLETNSACQGFIDTEKVLPDFRLSAEG